MEWEWLIKYWWAVLLFVAFAIFYIVVVTAHAKRSLNEGRQIENNTNRIKVIKRVIGPDPFGSFTERKIGFYIDAEELFEKLKNSTHMKKRGYTILNSGDYSFQGYDVYKLCLFKKNDKESFYLHLRFNFGKIDTIYCLIFAFGNEEVALADLEVALKEAR